MSDLNLSNDVLKNLLPLVTQGVAKDKLGGAADMIGSLLGGNGGGLGGLGGLASLAGGLLGGGGANDVLSKLASAVKMDDTISVRSHGRLPCGRPSVFSKSAMGYVAVL